MLAAALTHFIVNELVIAKKEEVSFLRLRTDLKWYNDRRTAQKSRRISPPFDVVAQWYSMK